MIIGYALADLGFGSLELQFGLVIFASILVVEVGLVGVVFVQAHQFKITGGRERYSFIATEASDMDNSTIALSQNNMDSLQLSYGDIVLVGPKWRKETVLIATPRQDVDDKSAQINCVVRRNLNIKLGDFINVRPYPSIKHVRNSVTSRGSNLTTVRPIVSMYYLSPIPLRALLDLYLSGFYCPIFTKHTDLLSKVIGLQLMRT